MKVSWDDYSQDVEKKNMFQITNQNMIYVDDLPSGQLTHQMAIEIVSFPIKNGDLP